MSAPRAAPDRSGGPSPASQHSQWLPLSLPLAELQLPRAQGAFQECHRPHSHLPGQASAPAPNSRGVIASYCAKCLTLESAPLPTDSAWVVRVSLERGTHFLPGLPSPEPRPKHQPAANSTPSPTLTASQSALEQTGWGAGNLINKPRTAGRRAADWGAGRFMVGQGETPTSNLETMAPAARPRQCR